MNEHISETDLLLAFDGELPHERNAAIRDHTQDCPACGNKWTALDRMSEQLTAMMRPDVAFRPQEAAVAALVARIDRPDKRRITPRVLVFANALAAVAAAAICLLMWPSFRGAKHPAPHPDAVYDFEEAVPEGYVSLPFGDPALPLDDASVLPVELSAEDLELMDPALSEAISDAQASALLAGSKTAVKAEILIGMDGWPRAIRIVE
jgi:hypothetical protein